MRGWSHRRVLIQCFLQQLLLNQAGIDVNVTDDQGKTALFYAKVNGKDEAISLLEKFT